MARRPDDTPALSLYLSEPIRALTELGAYLATRPLEPVLPRGDGHPVLVLPGLLADDASTEPLRATLRRLGHPVHGWRLGRNVGPTQTCVDGLRDRLETLLDRYQRPVSLIGWSLGGIFAREIARESPSSVRQVITLGSPYRMARASQSRAYEVYERYSHLHVTPATLPAEQHDSPLPVPTTSIYSRLDGIVDWRACLDRSGPRAENIEVIGSHVGMGHNPAVIFAIADRLAQPERTWSSFRSPRVLRSAFPRPDEPTVEYEAVAA